MQASRIGVLLGLALLTGCQTDDRTFANQQLEPGKMQLQQDRASSHVAVPPAPSVDRLPVFIRGTAAVYPISSLFSREPGSVIIEFTVGEDGIPRNFKVISATKKSFGDHAIIAIRDWRFEPALKNGKPVAFTIRHTTNFAVDGF